MSQSLINVTNLQGTSPQTRQVLESRLNPPAPQFFPAQELATLQTIAALVLPQSESATQVDLALFIDARLASGETMGWRFAELPPDPASFRTALRFFATHHEQPSLALLEQIQNRQHDTSAFAISRWFEGLKVELIRNWLAHPQTMALLNYQGFADDLLTPQDRA